MAAASTSRRSSGIGAALGQMWAWLKAMTMGAALGATLALGALRLAPQESAELAGPLACPGQAATVTHVQALEIKDWNQGVWVLDTPQLRCASAKGLEAAPGFAALWYGAFAAAGAGLSGLAYLAWAIIYYTAPASAPKPARSVKARKAARAVADDEDDEPEVDYPAQFLKECCEVGQGKRMSAAELNAAYAAWARAKGQRPPATRSLARDWRRLGLQPRGWGQPKAWRGARLKEPA